MTGLTKALLDAVMLSKPPVPAVIMMGREQHAIWRITERADAEGWDRRRVKREARKGSRSTYRKTAQ